MLSRWRQKTQPLINRFDGNLNYMRRIKWLDFPKVEKNGFRVKPLPRSKNLQTPLLYLTIFEHFGISSAVVVMRRM